LIVALVLLIVWAPGCPSGNVCALQPVPRWRILLLLGVAFGPGLYATRSWWRGRRPAG
jgi:hypothetical protein